ncbi:uncharacterized protein JCM15063_000383 [Sporobolomyces koalae]|uniref:uncharacterized protein n=1 Tax=Sporobolomyces koalae TaxID=500713 RepID=UPI0031705C61
MPRQSSAPPDSPEQPSSRELSSRSSTTTKTITDRAQLVDQVEARQVSIERVPADDDLDSSAAAASSLSTVSSKEEEQSYSRSQQPTRRASLDPDTAQVTTSSDPARRRVEPFALEDSDSDTRSSRQSEHRGMADDVLEPTTSEESDFRTGKHFELVVRQQPEIGAEAGLGKVTLGRLPIVPAPVVQLLVRDESGELIDVELPYLFCSCVLRNEDGSETVESSIVEGGAPGEDELSPLIGNLVRNPHRVQDLEGNTVTLLVFEDMSVRIQGRFTLEFRLGEARSPKSPILASVVSEPFNVVEWKEYPGRPAADIVTDLSLHLHHQGVPMYIPPLVLSQGPASPPPPSMNPFPSDHPDEDDLAASMPLDEDGELPPPSPP